jgi:hypothetical protein
MTTETGTIVPTLADGFGTVQRLAKSFEIALRARNLSPRTVRVYLEAVELLSRYLSDASMSTKVSALTREHLEAFLATELERVSPTSVHIRYRGLQQFLRWAVEDGETAVSPMTNMRPPVVPEQPVAMISPEQLAALVKACSGTDFASRRDLAIVRFFIDTGCRRQELTDLQVDDVDLRLRQATVTGKAGVLEPWRSGIAAPRHSTATSGSAPPESTSGSTSIASAIPMPTTDVRRRRGRDATHRLAQSLDAVALRLVRCRGAGTRRCPPPAFPRRPTLDERS